MFLACTLAIAGWALGGAQRGSAAATIFSVKAGRWSDPTVWSTGRLPGPADGVAIGHAVLFDVDALVSGVTIDASASLTFDPTRSVTLQSDANVIDNGTLVMHPSGASNHTLRFVGVNEAAFVGGGMDPLASDVGLWVVGAGVLDTAGTQKTGWTRATGTVAAGATSVTLSPAPTGWAVGDEVVIAPTEAPTVGARSYLGFDQATITSVSGATIGFNTPTANAHPQVNGQWDAEVMDLTRNVRIEGTAAGRSHVFIRSTKAQSVLYTAVRYMGPRKGNSDGFTTAVLGRYGLHFHMAGDGSLGSLVQGTVVRDTGAHAFVPHMSNGVTFRDDVSFNTFDDAYWWDGAPDTRTLGPDTNNVLYDHDIAALVQSDPDFRGYRLTGFNLGLGFGNTIKDSVGVGIQGNGQGSAFEWPEGGVGAGTNGEGVWTFNQGNVGHNNRNDGIFTWQNTGQPHDGSHFVVYNNTDFGIEHGAYGNVYTYHDGVSYGNRLAQLTTPAQSDGSTPGHQLSFTNIVFDGGGVSDYAVTTAEHNGAAGRTLICGSTFQNAKKAGFGAITTSNTTPEAYDLVNNTYIGNEFYIADAVLPGSTIRVQDPVHGAIQLAPKGGPGIYNPKWNANVTQIASFATGCSSSPPPPTTTTAPPTTTHPPVTTTHPPTTTIAPTTTTTTNPPTPSTATASSPPSSPSSKADAISALETANTQLGFDVKLPRKAPKGFTLTQVTWSRPNIIDLWWVRARDHAILHAWETGGSARDLAAGDPTRGGRRVSIGGHRWTRDAGRDCTPRRPCFAHRFADGVVVQISHASPVPSVRSLKKLAAALR